MPTEVTEDTIQLTIGLIEAETLRADGGPEHRASYPLPLLRPTSHQEVREFRSVVLENAYVRVSVVPDLGGRIVSFLDKRTGVDVLAGRSLVAAPGGSRGAQVHQGITFRLSSEARKNDLGTVQHLMEPGDDEGEAPSLWLAEITSEGLGWHLRLSVPHDRAELLLEARVHNRLLRPVAYNGAIHFAAAGEPTYLGDGFTIYNTETRTGFIGSLPPNFVAETVEGGSAVQRFREGQTLAPRQLDAWTLRIRPATGLDSIDALSEDLAVSFSESSLQIQATSIKAAHRAQLLTDNGQTMEAPADLYPERAFGVPLTGLPSKPMALAIVSPAREVVLSIDKRATPAERSETATTSPSEVQWPSSGMSEAELRAATFDVAKRHLAHVLLAHHAIRGGDYDAAGRELEQALLFNAEDHLTWWLKAVVARLAGDLGEERAELLNAHFLAPLEPALRAEGFLSQPPPEGKDPSFVVRPLQEVPETFIEVASLLLQAGLVSEAGRWLDESVRHLDMPMLRYLWAYTHLLGSGLDFEAAQHLSAAAKHPVGPPYPWREVEREALHALASRFPNDAVLSQYALLMDSYRQG